MKNSTDFAMGRRPKLKSEEVFISTFQGDEIIAILCLKPQKKCYTVREHDPVRAACSSLNRQNETIQLFQKKIFHAQRRLADGEMRAWASAERASALGLGETRPFATGTHQVDHGDDSLDTAPD